MSDKEVAPDNDPQVWVQLRFPESVWEQLRDNFRYDADASPEPDRSWYTRIADTIEQTLKDL